MKKIAIVGGGPAGCTCSYYALKNSENVITMFDTRPIMSSILPTGNGRCNFTYGEFDYKELAKNYPRGEKFLYSIFSRFGVTETLELFDELGIKYYMQDDMRYFPKSNSSKEIQNVFSKALLSNLNFKFIKQKVTDIKFLLNQYDSVVLATGGNIGSLHLIEKSGQKIINFKPALTALNVKNDYFFKLSGVVLKDVTVKTNKNFLSGDILLTHDSLSGPLIYKISSLNAFCDFPYCIYLNFTHFTDKKEFQKYFVNLISENLNKNLYNILSNIVPYSFSQLIVELAGLDINIKCNNLSKQSREKIIDLLFAHPVYVTGTRKYGETVMAGGVDTDYISSKNMESKLIKNLFFVGENLNIDGFCGGFNLQNCWSTGAICGKYLLMC